MKANVYAMTSRISLC